MSPEQLSLFGAPAAPAPKKRAEKEAAEKIVAPSAASAAPAPVDPLSLPEPPKDRPQERMAWLTTILEHHNYLYHTLDKPVISDDQYDALFRELKALEIDPEAVDPDDGEMLQDMIVAAVNEAMRAADSDASETMQKLTGGLGLPF